MDDLALAAELARDAGRLAAGMLRDGLAVRQKSNRTDLVSAADDAAEKLVVARLRAQRPDDGIVGEEGTSVTGTGRTWFVDPVDGTYNFLAGLPLWCTAVALDDVLGAVYHPGSDVLWAGGPEHRTTRGRRPLGPLADERLEAVSVATYLHPTRIADDELRRPLRRVLERAATVRMLGCGSLELAAVAAGQLGVAVHIDPPPWDWLPGAALVHGAGGTTQTVELSGHRWHIAGSRQVVADVSRLLTG